MLVKLLFSNISSSIIFNCEMIKFTSIDAITKKIAETEFTDDLEFFENFLDRINNTFGLKGTNESIEFDVNEIKNVVINDNSQSIFAFLPKENNLCFSGSIRLIEESDNLQFIKENKINVLANAITTNLINTKKIHLKSDSFLFFNNENNTAEIFLNNLS